MSERARQCLRCGGPVYVVGCCRDCRSVDPQLCEQLTSEARKHHERRQAHARAIA